jgi:hypothetical protein
MTSFSIRSFTLVLVAGATVLSLSACYEEGDLRQEDIVLQNESLVFFGPGESVGGALQLQLTNAISAPEQGPTDFEVRTGASLLEWHALTSKHAATVQDDSRPFEFQLSIPKPQYESLAGKLTVYIHEEAPRIHGTSDVWLPLLQPTTLTYQPETQRYQLRFSLWGISEKTTLVLARESEPLAPLPNPTLAASASPQEKSADRTDVKATRTRVAPLKTPWVALCLKSKLNHPEFCNPLHSDYILRFLSRAAEDAGAFLSEIENDPARPDLAWQEMAVSLLTEEEIDEYATSSLAFVSEEARKAGAAALVVFGRGECGTGYACYIQSQRLVFVEERSQTVPSRTGFTLDDILVHELFHAVQGQLLPELFSSQYQVHDLEWLIEGTAAYVQTQSAKQSLFGNTIWNSPRDWEIPLRTSTEVDQTLDSYKNYEFFAAITQGRKGELAALLRELDRYDLSDSYMGLGRVIHRIKGGQFSSRTRLEDPTAGSLGGALLEASQNSVLRKTHRCNADIDRAADLSEDTRVFRTRSLRPMSSHCRRIESQDPDIISGASCIEIEVPSVIGDRDPIGTFQVHAPGFNSVYNGSGSLEPKVLVSGPLIDLQLLDLDHRRNQTDSVTRRYSMKKVPCGAEPPTDAYTCADAVLSCTLTLDSFNGQELSSTCRVRVLGYEYFRCETRRGEGEVKCLSPSRFGTLSAQDFGVCDTFYNRIVHEVLSPTTEGAQENRIIGATEYTRNLQVNELLPFDRRCGSQRFCRVSAILEAQ